MKSKAGGFKKRERAKLQGLLVIVSIFYTSGNKENGRSSYDFLFSAFKIIFFFFFRKNRTKQGLS